MDQILKLPRDQHPEKSDCNSLQLTEKNFRDLAHSSPDAIFVYIDEKIIFANNTALKLLRSSKPDDVIGKDIWDFTPSSSHQSLKKAVELIITKRKNYISSEGKMITIDGEAIDIEISSTYFNFNGKNGIQAFIRDISKRKKAEGILAATQQHYRLLVENTKEAIAIIQDEMVRYVNPELSEITGYSEKQVLNKKFYKLVHPDFSDIVRNEYRHRLDGTESNTISPVKIIDTGNNERWFQINSVLTIWEEKPAVLLFFNDVTETKNAQDALMASEEKYRLLAENAKDIIIVYDENGTVNYLNSSGYETFGIHKEKNSNINVTDILFPGSVYPTPSAMMRKTNGDFKNFKSRIEVSNFLGEIIQLETISSPIKLDSENYGVLVVGRDITERKQLEREIILISERIRQQVSRDLHDDLNPHLIGVEALSQVLSMSLKKKQISESADAEKITTLINKAITKTHRLARGLCPIDLESSGIQTPLMNLIKVIRNLYGVECKFNYDESIIIEDITLATNLYYIAQEATLNSAKYSGGTLITITLKRSSDTLTLSIEDNGSGILKDKEKSNGMGLKIMKYRAEIIDGVFSIRSNKPGGTAIIVKIPINILKSEGRISYGGRFPKAKQETEDLYS